MEIEHFSTPDNPLEVRRWKIKSLKSSADLIFNFVIKVSEASLVNYQKNPNLFSIYDDFNF